MGIAETRRFRIRQAHVAARVEVLRPDGSLERVAHVQLPLDEPGHDVPPASSFEAAGKALTELAELHASQPPRHWSVLGKLFGLLALAAAIGISGQHGSRRVSGELQFETLPLAPRERIDVLPRRLPVPLQVHVEPVGGVIRRGEVPQQLRRIHFSSVRGEWKIRLPWISSETETSSRIVQNGFCSSTGSCPFTWSSGKYTRGQHGMVV